MKKGYTITLKNNETERETSETFDAKIFTEILAESGEDEPIANILRKMQERISDNEVVF